MSLRGWGEGCEDGELVAACRAGDTNAFEELVLRHQKAMLNLAYRVVGNYEEACEVVQDAFIAAYRGLASFREEAQFKTWMTTITLNHARNAWTRLNAQRRKEAYSLNVPRCTEDGDVKPDPPSEDPSTLTLLEDQDLRRQVEFCIAALSIEFREVLILRDFQDHPYEIICSVLKLREGTVKSRLFRARESVKACLKKALGAL